MPEIKWIKITTEMFDDEKIRIIEAMPEADTLIVLWIRLVCMAGKVNAGGHIFLSPNLPYNTEQLAAIFNRPLNTVRLALQTFDRLKMIDISDDGSIFLPNFEKHQNIEGMERIKQLGAKRSRHFRKRQKVKLIGTGKVSNVTATLSNATDKNRIDKIREEEKIWNNILEILSTKMSKTNFKLLLEDSWCLEMTTDEIIIGVPHEHQAKQLEETQASIIANVVSEVTKESLVPKFVLVESENLTNN